MRDYMIALQRRFHIPSERSEELKREARTAYDTLHDTLSREQRKLLLQLIDAENSYRDEEKIDAFFSGFKLADGIRQELGEPYDYEAENETLAQEIFRSSNENRDG